MPLGTVKMMFFTTLQGNFEINLYVIIRRMSWIRLLEPFHLVFGFALHVDGHVKE